MTVRLLWACRLFIIQREPPPHTQKKRRKKEEEKKKKKKKKKKKRRRKKEEKKEKKRKKKEKLNKTKTIRKKEKGKRKKESHFSDLEIHNLKNFVANNEGADEVFTFLGGGEKYRNFVFFDILLVCVVVAKNVVFIGGNLSTFFQNLINSKVKSRWKMLTFPEKCLHV